RVEDLTPSQGPARRRSRRSGTETTNPAPATKSSFDTPKPLSCRAFFAFPDLGPEQGVAHKAGLKTTEPETGNQIQTCEAPRPLRSRSFLRLASESISRPPASLRNRSGDKQLKARCSFHRSHDAGDRSMHLQRPRLIARGLPITTFWSVSRQAINGCNSLTLVSSALIGSFLRP
ncbi:hypothetical protein M2310_005307, partial [Rhizobium leguminosarum]|nr:hypothetical protein [Rhizobium esperanzae]MDH6204620.1 hypothetical protein [Rhizobium leguminosarum]